MLRVNVLANIFHGCIIVEKNYNLGKSIFFYDFPHFIINMESFVRNIVNDLRDDFSFHHEIANKIL